MGDEVDTLLIASRIDPDRRATKRSVVAVGPPHARNPGAADGNRLFDVARRGDERDGTSGRRVQDGTVRRVFRCSAAATGLQRHEGDDEVAGGDEPLRSAVVVSRPPKLACVDVERRDGRARFRVLDGRRARSGMVGGSLQLAVAVKPC